MWGFGALLLVGLVLLAVVVVRLVTDRSASARDRSATERTPPPTGAGPVQDPARAHGRSSAREVLDHRYATGEIGTDEYHERRDALGDER